MTPADQQTLAAGRVCIFRGRGRHRRYIELVADFPDYVPHPLPGFPAIVRGSNPFGLVVVADQIYRNGWRTESGVAGRYPTGSFSPLATFPTIPNLLPGGRRSSRRGCRPVSDTPTVGCSSRCPRRAGQNRDVHRRADEPSTGSQMTVLNGLKRAMAVLGIRDGRRAIWSSRPSPGRAALRRTWVGPGSRLTGKRAHGARRLPGETDSMLRDAKTGAFMSPSC